MLEIECLSADRCTVDHFPNERDVVRVHPVDDDIDRSSDRGIILEYSVALLGPEDFSARDVPAKTASVAKPLRLREIGLADLQRGIKFLEISHLVFQISARLPKRRGCTSLRCNQSN